MTNITIVSLRTATILQPPVIALLKQILIYLQINRGFFHPSICEYFFLYSALNYTCVLTRCGINF
jgi:hypothetical protein